MTGVSDMSYREHSIEISRVANGYTVRVSDPAIVEANRKNDRYRDPNVTYAFKTVKEVLKFLGKSLDKALPDDSFGTAFDNELEKAANDG